jgi:hypothetical protein
VKISLLSGAYSSRNTIAAVETCINLIPEINPEEVKSPEPVTHFPRPGLTPFGNALAVGVGRGVFISSRLQLFSVIGNTVYFINSAGAYFVIGNLLPVPGQVVQPTTPVSFTDNGQTIVIVDGTVNGYTINMVTFAFAKIVDPTGLFVGATRTDYADTFAAFNAPGTNEWYITLAGQIAFNILNQANKTSSPDPIQTLGFNLRQMWLLGLLRSEVWYLSGAADFPYEEFPQTFIPYGCAAPYSLAQADDKLFWLSRNPQGQCIAVRTEGYAVVAISTRALEYEWSNYATVADCISYSYQQAGHTYIVFHFPTANTSWAHDLSTKQWHRRTYTDANGNQNRELVAFSVFAYGNNIGQDWTTGQLYILDQNTFTDNAQPMYCERAFPHTIDELENLTAVSFIADFETGETPNTGEGDPIPPQVGLSISRDGGVTFGNVRWKQMVSAGHNRSMLRWRGIGMARDFVFKLQWSFAGKSALQGAFVDLIEHGA